MKKCLLIVSLVVLAFVSFGCGISEDKYNSLLEQYDAILSERVALFSDLGSLKAWLAEQPVLQNPGFVIPQTKADYETNDEKGRVTGRNALALQMAAAADGYLVSVCPVQIGDGDLYVSINIAILKNGDVYTFGADGEEPTFWTNIGDVSGVAN